MVLQPGRMEVVRQRLGRQAGQPSPDGWHPPGLNGSPERSVNRETDGVGMTALSTWEREEVMMRLSELQSYVNAIAHRLDRVAVLLAEPTPPTERLAYRVAGCPDARLRDGS